MKKLNNNVKALSLFATLMINQLMASQIRAETSSAFDLVAINVPEQVIEQNPLHYSQAISSSALSLSAKTYTTISDEYWLEVSGAQLKSGVMLDINQPGALIRLSGKNASAENAVASLAIDPQQIQFLKNNKVLTKAFSQKVSQQQLATANIFPNSSAVKLDETIGRGQFKLQVTQPLYSDERYLINVKEKGSEHNLTLSLANQSVIAQQMLTLDLAMHNGKGQLALAASKALIKTPTGTFLPVEHILMNGKQMLELPKGLAESNKGELFELHISTEANDQGLKVRRNAKVAFAIAQPTAKMTGTVAVKRSHANVQLNIASEGRYEVSAIVSGFNKKGIREDVMLSRSAYYLKPGEQDVKLMFNARILKGSNVSPPFRISQIRLVDQSRMALLQQL